MKKLKLFTEQNESASRPILKDIYETNDYYIASNGYVAAIEYKKDINSFKVVPWDENSSLHVVTGEIDKQRKTHSEMYSNQVLGICRKDLIESLKEQYKILKEKGKQENKTIDKKDVKIEFHIDFKSNHCKYILYCNNDKMHITNDICTFQEFTSQSNYNFEMIFSYEYIMNMLEFFTREKQLEFKFNNFVMFCQTKNKEVLLMKIRRN